jgi:hypothetical protein
LGESKRNEVIDSGLGGTMRAFYLERIDRAANVWRFYYAFVAPTMVAPICVVQLHGRKGVWQRTLPPLTFADEASAVQWLEKQHQRKLRRG